MTVEIQVLFHLGTRPADRRIRVQIQDTLRTVGISGDVSVASAQAVTSTPFSGVALSALNPTVLKFDGLVLCEWGSGAFSLLHAGDYEG